MGISRPNFNIRFYMGANFRAAGVDVDEMLALVRSHYLAGKRDGDVAGALADLIGVVNRRMAGDCIVPNPYAPGLRRSAALNLSLVDVVLRCYFAGQTAKTLPDERRLLDYRWDLGSVHQLPAGNGHAPDLATEMRFEVPFDVLPAAGADSVWTERGGEPDADGWINGLHWYLTLVEEGDVWRLESFTPDREAATPGR